MIDRMSRTFFAFLAVAAAACATINTPAASQSAGAPDARSAAPLQPVQGERHLRNIRQLTFGGENAEAYFSFDGKQIIFQSTRDGARCDQQYTMNADGSNVRRVSSGQGRTTCGFFTPNGREIV